MYTAGSIHSSGAYCTGISLARALRGEASNRQVRISSVVGASKSITATLLAMVSMVL
jgi:hypothetical protein